MAVAIASEVLATDGDAAFLRVNNRKPAHALQPGEVARALNCRFEQGKPGPRLGVASDDWGRTDLNLIPSSAVFSGVAIYTSGSVMTVGATYRFTNNSPAPVSVQIWATTTPVQLLGSILSGGTVEFTAQGDVINLYSITQLGQPVRGITLVSATVEHNTLAYERFNDPVSGTDNAILITDEWRSADSGRGRAWRIYSNQGPQEIPLNGHDVWDRCSLVQCGPVMLLLRGEDERHYFDSTNLNGTDNEITLNCTPSWGVGEYPRVQFNIATTGAAIFGTTPPAAGNYYFARLFSGNIIKLYQGVADAAADTNELDFTASGALGKFYIKLATTPIPFFGNGAPNLIMQGDALGTPGFEIGFEPVPENIPVTNTTATLIDAANHGFMPGDAVTPTGLTIGTGGPYFAYPVDAHHLTLHTSATAALTGASAISTITPGGTGSIKKTNASGLPLPSCRAGTYLNGRFWGVNGRDTLIFSDPNDPLHCTLYQSTLPANQGEAGRVNWIVPLGEDAILIGKDLKVIILVGVSGATSGWTEGTVTNEYGGIAALAAENVGTDAWFLSRKGVASVVRTVAGEKLGVARTISQDIPQDLQDVDWFRANIACSATWNGRYFIAVPGKGQETPVNNRVLVLNFLNGNLAVSQAAASGDIVGGVQETGGQVDSWEGVWTGDLLTPFAFARLTVNGEERLTFATPNGVVCWFHDGWDDAGEAIASEVLTRGYFGGREMLTLRGKLSWESFNPEVTASILTAGVNEEETLAGFSGLTYDRTKYLTDGQEDYDPSTSTSEQFSAPDREDYSPSPEELLVATLDTHQHLSEPFRCRLRGVAPQVRVRNANGSLRLTAVSLQAKPVGVVATRKS